MIPIYQKPRLGDIRHSFADISKTKTFGYEPTDTLLCSIRLLIVNIASEYVTFVIKYYATRIMLDIAVRL